MFPHGPPGDTVHLSLAMFVVGLCLTSPRNIARVVQLGGLAVQGPLPFVHYIATLVTVTVIDSRALDIVRMVFRRGPLLIEVRVARPLLLRAKTNMPPTLC